MDFDYVFRIMKHSSISKKKTFIYRQIHSKASANLKCEEKKQLVGMVKLKMNHKTL